MGSQGVPGVDLAPILAGLGSHFRCILGLIFVFFLWLSLLQNCYKSAARMLDSRFAARLPACPPAPALQDHCCKSAAWLLQGLL